jgi:hypothetical protein
MTYNIYDFAGNIGVICILVAYLLIQINRMDSNSKIYSVLNAVGSLLIIVSLFFEFNLSAFLIEFFWLLISIYGLIKTKTKAKPM